MGTLMTIVLSTLGVISIIGIIRVMIEPYKSLADTLLSIFLLDLLFDLLGWIFEAISGIWD